MTIDTTGLGMTIRALRKMRGITQAELAKRVGISRTSVTNIETGRQTLSAPMVNAIAWALGYRAIVKFIAL